MFASIDIINKIFLDKHSNFTFSDGTEKRFTSFEYFNNFVNEELNFWKDYDKSQTIKIIHDRFYKIRSHLNSINDINNESDIDSIFSNIKNLTTSNKYFVYSNSKFGKFLCSQYKINPSIVDFAYKILMTDEHAIPNNKYQFLGIGAAYNYMQSSMLEEDEKKAFDRLEQINLRYIDKLEEFKENHFTLTEQYKIELEKSLANLDSSNIKFLAQTDRQQKDYEFEISKVKNEFESLRKTYHEELRLKEPAKYWDELKNDYNKKGMYWTFAALGVGLILGLIRVLIFYNFPFWLKGQITSDHLKGFIIFALFVSVFTYLLSIFVKYSTSCFHLSRDANERHQLTHVYLALLNEKAIETSEREIILQALFSRADTGLLKNDGGPTMPGTMGVLDGLFKFKGK
ncbi:MAG: DUF6161 domain-containing protein [Bacteroidetes bacterium]|nr:DUF6161 domain-containing protein [Bacteroidota bacterium]